MSVLVLLAACGGGGGGGGTDPAPTPATPATPATPGGTTASPPAAPAATALPAMLAAEVPATVEAGAAVVLKTALPATATDLRYDWDFGDGQRSTEPQPAHAWAAPGRYDWRLTVRNGDGTTASAAGTVQAGAFARLAGAECTGGAAKTGWCWPGSATTGAFALDVHCADALRCVAVGDFGQTAATGDGGRTWTLSRVPSFGETLARVRMASADTVYAFGGYDGRSVWRSRDGGRTWVLASRPDEPLIPPGTERTALGAGELWAPDADTLVATGWTSRISRDGGVTWAALPLRVTDVSPGGALWDDGAGRLPRVGVARFSPDRGATVWTVPLDHGTDGSTGTALAWVAPAAASLRAVVRDTAAGGFTTGYRWLSTDDGGRRFEQAALRLPPLPAGLVLDAMVLRPDGSGDAAAVPLSATCGTAPAAPARWLRTADGGRTWSDAGELAADGACVVSVRPTRDRSGWVVRALGPAVDAATGTLQPSVHWVAFDPPQRAVVSAADATAARVDRSGGGPLQLGSATHWIALAPDAGAAPLPLPAAGVAPPMGDGGWVFFDALNGLRAEALRLWSTVDGGRTWSPQPDDVAGPRGPALARLPDGSVWRTDGSRGWRSVDGGRTWSALGVPAGVVDGLFLLDAQRAWAGRCMPAAGASDGCTPMLARSVDGGAAWADVGPLPARPAALGGLTFADARSGLLQGADGRVWWTADGGATWARSATVDGAGGRTDTQAAGRVRRGGDGLLAWLPARLASGREAILRSADGGRTWRAVEVPVAAAPLGSVPGAAGVADVFSLDDRRLWAVGAGGAVLASDDGGQTWWRQDSGTGVDLSAVFALDARTVWAAGGPLVLTSSTAGEGP